jgi:hypothetical protein
MKTFSETLRPFVEAYDWNPGSDELENEESIVVRVTLGDWRAARRRLDEADYPTDKSTRACVDCKWHQPNPAVRDPELANCTHDALIRHVYSVVTGHAAPAFAFCTNARKNYGRDDECGVAALLWEPKEEVRDIDDAADRAEAETQHHTEVNDAALSEGRHK